MIKAIARAGDGRYLIVLGLSEENVRRMKQNQPIYFDLDQLQFPAGAEVGHVALFYGGTEAECAKTIDALIGPQTTVFMVPRGTPKPQ